MSKGHNCYSLPDSRAFPIYSNFRVVLSCLFIFFSLTSFSLLAAEETESAHSNGIAQLGSEQLNQKLEELKQSLAGIPEGAEASEQDQQNKVTLQKQLSLLEELISQKDSLNQLTEQETDNSAAIEKAKVRLAELSAIPAEDPDSEPEIVDPASIDLTALENQLNQAREKKTGLVNQQLQQQKLEDELSGYLQAANTRFQEAEQRESMLTKSKADEQSQTALALVDKQIENTQIDKFIAKQSETLFEARRQWYRNNEPLVQVELEVIEIEIAKLEAQLEAYHQALEQELAEQAKQAEEELLEKERTAQEAKEPDKRFIAGWEAAIARSQKNISEYQAMAVTLTKETTEQEKWLALENDEFITIKNLLSGQDNYDASDRIKRSLQQLQQHSDLLRSLLRDEMFTRVSEYRERSFAIADILYGLTDEFEKQQQEVLSELEESQQAAFKASGKGLLLEYRNILRDEKAALTEVISYGQKLAVATEQRLTKLEEFERFVQSSSFWIRDSKPLSLQMLSSVPSDLKKNFDWLKDLISARSREQLSEGVKTTQSMLYMLALFLVLPVILYLLRRYLRGLSVRINDRVQSEGKLVYLAVFVLITGFLSAALLPAYFFVIARLAEVARLPADLNLVSSKVFDHLALFFLLWFFSRSFFAGRSITEVQFDLPRNVANRLYSGFRWFLVGYLLLLPAVVLTAAPFNNHALPQFFSLLFLILTTVSVYRLTRPQSDFVQHQLKALNVERVTTGWVLVSRLLVLVAFSTIVLSAAGYQYASQSIVYRLAGTLLLFALFPPLYRLVRQNFVRFVEQRVRKAATAETEPVDKAEQKNNTVRIFKFVAIVLGALILLRIWGVDEQALLTLDDIQLYKVQITGAEPEFVTLGSYVRSIVSVFVVFWAMRNLAGFMNVWLFPHWGADVGVKYAVTTISRYGLFLVGVIYIISELHLDIAKLGWLMAAIGVGLGFGLQEIVSNFVSGLILLAERPVKPGDTITIGDLTGTVSHINIRATTIVNFDRQEVMVPNRNLITNEVINWTRSDTINRVVIGIGVAYGSDLDHVTELLMGIAKDQPKVLNFPRPNVLFMQHGDSSLDLELRVFVSSPDDILSVRDQINRQISKVFGQENIEIPFPQRDLNIRTANLAGVLERPEPVGS
ncbi:mechanosensitive ion channel [Vibrio sp. JC009]|uniref:mechanosensitive ion channel domain-containing protein n=1 Tax=Vibrio sp. JC009 TaxID=2912314 RepID=UPI0023AF07EC|nr:mechanosensitive ion channel domain-containing protein [Vibrio sp. JC009]WED21444.1 mechanosensitive ion channel [Vibrio sp. JC009]